MTTEDILKLRNLGEVSKVQFKERILDKYDIGCELVAMSNARGGQLVIGINDKTGAFNPLSYAEEQETINLLSNMASENVVPNILLEIGKVFQDKVNDAVMEGNILHQFETIMSFFTRNLKNVQVGKDFNSLGELEIPYVSLMEFVVNALVHRSLNWKAPIRIFIFDNRVEIHSPGTLPNGLQVEDITNGTSMPRNNFLFSNAIYLLPYTGVGSGIQRALEEGVQVEFTNDERIHEFLITIERNEVTDSDTQRTDSDNKQGKNGTDSDTSNEHSDTHSDTNRMKLTPKQQDLVNYCSVPRSSREILERAGVSYHSKNIQTYITLLIDAGYLEMTNPDNPTAHNQKYRKK